MKHYIFYILLLTCHTFFTTPVTDADVMLRRALRVNDLADCEKAIKAGAQLNEIYEDDMLSGEFGCGTPLYFALCLQDTWANTTIIDLFLKHGGQAHTRTDFVPEFIDDENEEENPETIT